MRIAKARYLRRVSQAVSQLESGQRIVERIRRASGKYIGGSRGIQAVENRPVAAETRKTRLRNMFEFSPVAEGVTAVGERPDAAQLLVVLQFFLRCEPVRTQADQVGSAGTERISAASNCDAGRLSVGEDIGYPNLRTGVDDIVAVIQEPNSEAMGKPAAGAV